MRIRTIIVDDEPLGRTRVRRLLEAEDDVTIVAECANGREAVQAVAAHTPDLLLLDVQMPLMNGFDVLRALDTRHLPFVIFVTAYDDYAVQAFSVHALDYLVKPFDRDRFRTAIEHARTHLARRQLEDVRERLLELLGSVAADGPTGDTRDAAPTGRQKRRFVVKSIGKITFVDAADVDWIEATGNYVKLHVGKKVHLMRDTMTRIEDDLDPDRFMRIHRSTMVNVERIVSMSPRYNNEYDVVLRDGTRLKTSRTYKDRIQAYLDRL